MEDVGDHQQAIGSPQRGRPSLLHGEQLIEGIDFHELQTGGGEDLVAGNGLLGHLDHRAVTRIAVADRVGQQGPVATQKREVDAPRVDAHRGHRLAVPHRRGPQPVDDLLPEPHEVPDEFTPHRHRTVLEPVNLLQFDQPPVE